MNGETDWDVIVVGAGPAGSLAARGAARAGLKALLLDRARFPRPKVCGCCLNQHARSALKNQGLETLLDSLGAIPLNRFQLGAGNRTRSLALPGGVALSREAMDVALIEEAKKSGVTFREGLAIKGFEVANDRVELNLSDGIHRSKLLVDAGGLNSQLTLRDMTIREGSRIGAGTVLEANTPNFAPGTIFMATGKGGYVGLVRLEDGRLDVAAALDRKAIAEFKSIGKLAESILRHSGLPPLPQLESADWKGTPALTRTPRRVAGPRWFAVGDAAGYIEPFTGEGMAWAMAGAASLIPLLEKSVGNWQPEHATEWGAIHRRHIGERQWACRFLAGLLRSPFACRMLVRVLGLFPRLAKPFLNVLNRPLALPGVR